MMQSDTLKLLFTYLIALIVIVGGGAMLYYTPDDNLQLVVAGFIGSAITFVFSQESAKQATRAAQSSTAAANEAAK
jgi:hypothetical protein